MRDTAPRKAPLLCLAASLLLASMPSDAGPLAFQSVSCPVKKGGSDVAVADLNRDGAVDVVVLVGKRFAIITGLGDGTFAKVVYVSGGNVVSGFCIQDLNRDLWPDIAYLGAQGVSVLLGTPTGRFAKVPRTPLRYPFMGIACGNLDGDGIPDLVVGRLRLSGGPYGVEHSSYYVVVFRGLGDGRFSDIGQYDAREYPSAIAIADLDCDGTPDVAVSDRADQGAVLVRRGLGGGLLGEQLAYPSPRPTGLVATDLDGDGWPDLALASDGQDAVAVLRGGPAGLGPAALYPLANLNGCIAAGDLDGDGLQDLVVTTGRKTGAAVVLRGLPGGGYDPGTAFPVAPDPRGVALADVNGDQRLDAVVSGYAGKELVVLLNAGAQTR